jgi:GNAT superfamily N-acetyltransferase
LLSFRPATEADLEIAVQAARLAAPDHRAAEADEVKLFWEYSDALGDVRRWVVGQDGFLSVSREGDEPHAWVELDLTAPTAEAWAEGYGFGEEQAWELGALEGVAEVWEDQPAAIGGLRSRGWSERRRLRHWQLELQPARERLRSERDAAVERLGRAGLAIRPASDWGGEAIYPALREIHDRTQPDIPRSVAFVPEPYEVWKTWMEAPRVRPERVWVAVADGRPVGYSYLAFRSNGLVETGYTCLLRDFRGRGLARAMKLESLVQAAELGVAAAQTDNDAENAAIIGLNQSLGYREIVGRVEFAKDLVR